MGAAVLPYCRTAVRCSSGCTCGGWRCCTRSSCSGPQRTTSSFWPQSSERTLLCPAYRIHRTLFVPHVPPELPYRPRTVASNSVLQPLFHSTQPALDHPTIAGSPAVSSACLPAPLLRPARAHICTRTRPLRRSHVCAGMRPHLRRDAPTSAPGRAHVCAGMRPRLRRDAPTSAPGRTHVCAGTCRYGLRLAELLTPSSMRTQLPWRAGYEACSRPSARGSEGAGRSVGQPAFADAFGFRMLYALIGAPWVQRPVSREDRERLAVAAAARAARDHRVLGPDAGE